MDSSNQEPSRPISVAAALRPGAWLLAAYACVRTVLDPDLWGHVRFGQDMLRDGAMARVDPYSFTQDVPWINHEWLSELQMGGAYSLAGPLGLVLLKAVIVASTIALVWGALRQAALAWRWGAAMVATLGLLPILMTVRPQLWTALLLALLLRCLTAGGRRLWAVPVLFVIWANLHGGWLLGLAVLAAWEAGRLAQGSIDRRDMAVSALSVLATLLTPYGPELWMFLGSTVRISRADITEWAPVWSNALSTLFWGGGVALAGLSWRANGRPPLPALGVMAVLAVVSFRVQRVMPLFMLGTTLVLAPQFPRTRSERATPAQTMLDVVICAVGLVLAFSIGAIPRCITTAREFRPDPITFAALVEARPAGRMITSFNWGEAALARLGPALKVSVDGRRETVYSEATLAEQAAILSGTPSGLAALARLSPDYVWLPLPAAARTRQWLSQNGYRIDVDAADAFVASRADVPPILPPSIQLSTCFPMDPAS